jgi:hypothetical protein
MIKTRKAEEVAEEVFLLSSRAKRGICFSAKLRKKQIPRANPALRNDSCELFRRLWSQAYRKWGDLK